LHKNVTDHNVDEIACVSCCFLIVRGSGKCGEISETTGQSYTAAQRWVQETAAAHGNTVHRGFTFISL